MPQPSATITVTVKGVDVAQNDAGHHLCPAASLQVAPPISLQKSAGGMAGVGVQAGVSRDQRLPVPSHSP